MDQDKTSQDMESILILFVAQQKNNDVLFIHFILDYLCNVFICTHHDYDENEIYCADPHLAVAFEHRAESDFRMSMGSVFFFGPWNNKYLGDHQKGLLCKQFKCLAPPSFSLLC